jgi:hypothetical protein
MCTISSNDSGVRTLLVMAGSGASSRRPLDLAELTILTMVCSLKLLAGAEELDLEVASEVVEEAVVVLVDSSP